MTTIVQTVPNANHVFRVTLSRHTHQDRVLKRFSLLNKMWLMSIRKSRFTTALMWAMIPLTVFGSLPRMGCICANGQHKLFCERYRNCDADGRCTCCYGRATAKIRASQETQSRPGGEMTCCSHRRAGTATDCPVVGSDRPCRPVLHNAVYLNSPKLSLDLDRADCLPPFAVLAFEPLPAIVPNIAADFMRGELLPPPDLVITFGVMLI
jgi:hypothetical protein